MAQFFEYKCELQAANLGVTASAWSAGDQPVLAVAADNGTIAFYAEEVPYRTPLTASSYILYISCLGDSVEYCLVGMSR